MENELISVIVPVFNVEKYLKKCVDSIIGQTYDNIEIILIDDGSTDNSGTICDSYLQIDSRVQVFHCDNNGVSSARNKGLKHSNGKYIFWLDSDDYISRDCISVLYSLIKRYDSDMAICNYVDGEDRDYIFNDDNCEVKSFDSKIGLENIYKNHHYSFVMAASWAKLIRKELYEDLEYPEGKIFEDIYISHYLINKCKKITYINKIMYYYFQWSKSILGKELYKAKLDYLEAFEDRIVFFDNLGYYSLKEKARIQYLHSLIWEYSRAKYILEEKRITKEIVKSYRKYYTIGTFNPNLRNENKKYMFIFYISPRIAEIMDIVKNKIVKR